MNLFPSQIVLSKFVILLALLHGLHGYVEGFCPSAKRLARPERRCSETSAVVTEWIPCYNARDLYTKSHSYPPPPAPFEVGDARPAVFWRGNGRCYFVATCDILSYTIFILKWSDNNAFHLLAFS